MITLTLVQCRVLGTLIEKAQTVPGQYPITINALTTGCNQKNARDPVTSYTEEDIFETLESLRALGFVREAQVPGSRVPKYRHVLREALGLGVDEVCVLAELFLRGPQSAAELRSNVARMTNISAERFTEIIAHLSGPVTLPGALPSDTPSMMVRELPRRPGERATRLVHLLAPYSEPPVLERDQEATEIISQPYSREDISKRVSAVENQIIELKSVVDRLARAIDDLGT